MHITPESPLADRKLRNTLEHWDERVEEWAIDRRGRSRSATDIDFGVQRPDDPEVYVGRRFDVVDKEMTVGRDSMRLEPIYKESLRIYGLVQALYDDVRTPDVEDAQDA